MGTCKICGEKTKWYKKHKCRPPHHKEDTKVDPEQKATETDLINSTVRDVTNNAIINRIIND